MSTPLEVRAVQGEQVICGARVLGLVYRDPSDPHQVIWRWITRQGAWGASATREAALMRVMDRVAKHPLAPPAP